MSAMVETHDTISKLKSAIGSVFLGKGDVVRGAMVALLGHGHILIEDVPGVGKTLLARSIARCIDGSFRRIQFTPDLLPSDIIGTNIYDTKIGDFVFKRGPLFASIVLADEINRTSPRTQSALLEAMNDSQVSVDGRTYHLDNPFLVLATQNPFEFEGTYPLPESQLDRFMVRLRIGYPTREAERRLLADHRDGEPVNQLRAVVTLDEIRRLQDSVRQVNVDVSVSDYMLDIVEATRRHKEVEVGASTRGALMLYRACQALATLKKRDFVVPDDVKEMTLPVLAHRLISRTFVGNGSTDVRERILEEILDLTPIPE